LWSLSRIRWSVFLFYSDSFYRSMHSEYINKHRSCDEIKTNHLIIFYAYYDYLICAFIASMNSNRIEWVDRGFEPRLGPTKDYAIGICCFSVKHVALRGKNKTGWVGIRIMCPSGATCLPADCCFSELAL
jgi:hypothetical protein